MAGTDVVGGSTPPCKEPRSWRDLAWKGINRHVRVSPSSNFAATNTYILSYLRSLDFMVDLQMDYALIRR